MEDVAKEKGSEPKIVDITTEESIRYWAQQLTCSRADLIKAVIQVGNSFNAVDAYLEMNRKKRNHS